MTLRIRERAEEGAGSHPASIQTASGPINLGVHAWHCLLDSASALDPPEQLEHGVTRSQKANILATLESMNPR